MFSKVIYSINIFVYMYNTPLFGLFKNEVSSFTVGVTYLGEMHDLASSMEVPLNIVQLFVSSTWA